jgi:hypothetical protein
MKRNHGAEKFASELLELVKEHHAKPSLHNKTCFCYDCKLKAKEKDLIERIDNQNKFFTRDGLPSMYAFACGHVAKTEKEENRISLFKDGVWHVRGFMADQHIWESFDLFKDARLLYKQLAKQIKQK